MERSDKRVYLDINYAFGSNFASSVKSEIGIIEEDGKMKLVYLTGKTVVKKCIDSHQMEFIKLSDNIESIECMAISPTRNHIAICQKIRNQSFLLLNVYGLKNRDSQIKHFKLPQTQKQSSFQYITFSPSQPKYACCMTGAPEFQLMFIDISRSRGLAVSNFSVEGADALAICPTQSHLISCSGKNILKLFKIEDYSFKAYEEIKKLPKNRNFTSHAWFDKTKLLAGTDKGELFMIGPVGNNFEVKRHYSNALGLETATIEESLEHNTAITAICVFEKGFILGSNRGKFSLWIKKEETQENFEDEYTGDLTKKWKVPDNRVAEVTCIAMSPNQEQIVVSFNNNLIALTKMSILLGNEDSLSQGTNIEEDVFSYLYQGFHNGPISSMDVCLHRPIIATLSKPENIIRIWNYKNPNCELVKKFDAKLDQIQEASQLLNCLALHPLGYYMAVGCCDKLRLYHILESDLRNYRQIVLRGVCQLKFSDGGHMLAAAYPKQKYNLHVINVYNSYTLEEIGRLSDSPNVITDLAWKFDDKYLYSSGIDGTVSEWKQNQSRVNSKDWICNRRWSINNSRYLSIMYERNAKSILVSGFESNKPVIREFKIEKQQVQKLYSLPFRCCKLKWLTSQWNVPAVIAASEDGCLKIFNSPFDNIIEQTLNLHLQEITNIEVSPCGRYVFSAGKDGIMFIHQVTLTNREGFVNRRINDQINDYELNPLVGIMDEDLADIVLVQRNDMNEKIRYTNLLEKNLDELEKKLVLQDEDENRKQELEIQKVSNEKQQKINELTEEFESLNAEKKHLQASSQNQFADLQNKNTKMLEDLQNLYEKKLALENKKYFDLEVNFEGLTQEQEREIRSQRQRSQHTIEMLKKEFTDCFRKAEKIHNQQQSYIQENEKQFQERTKQIQEEHENQLKNLGKSIINLEEVKEEKSAKYITKIESLKRECKILHEEIVTYMSENDHIRQLTSDIDYELQKIEKSLKKKNNEVEEKQENLKKREEKIGLFQERIGDLQKKREVLSYRTWEMRQELEPKEDQIEFLKEEIFELEKGIENVLKNEKVLNDTQIKLKKNKDTIKRKIQEQSLNTKDKNGKVKRIVNQINNIVQNYKAADRRVYYGLLRALYEKNCHLMTQTRRINHSLKGIDEMGRHLDYLDHKIQDINKKTEYTLKQRDDEIDKVRQDNSAMIKELERLRKQKIQLQSELKNTDKIIDNLRRQTNSIKNTMETDSRGHADFPPKKVNQPQGSVLKRASSQPTFKGKVVRGQNYDSGSLSIFTKAKLKDLENKLNFSKKNLRRNEMLVRIYKQAIGEHMEGEKCSDQLLQKCLIQYEL